MRALISSAALVAVSVILYWQSRRLPSAFRRDVQTELLRANHASLVTEADLAPLPQQLQMYLRRVGVVNRPRVKSFRAEFAAEMRGAPDASWMHATADQYEFFAPAARLFFMRTSRGGVPFFVFHRYVGDSASMDVRVAGIIPMVKLAGDEMTRSETVTLFNDMCALAPASLIDAPVSWVEVDDHTVRGTFTNAGHVVSADLVFDANGDLVDFRSADRSMSEGKTMRRLPWTTPLSDYRSFDGVRLAALGEACWTDGGRTWTYGRFVLKRIVYNPPPARGD
jgi:hypothetical protein